VLAGLQRALLLGAQIFPAQGEMRRGFETVELEVDMRARLRQLSGETAVARQPDPVGVHHDEPDAALLRHVDEVDELGMDSRLSAGELDDFRLALGGDEAVEHEGDLATRQ
jgi:hypothetical protein